MIVNIEDKIKKLEMLIKFLEENNINLLSCGCCGGIGIKIDGIEITPTTICDIEDMKCLLEKYQENYKEN